MINITAAFLLNILNYLYAIVIYLSLHGWIVAHEPSGMQLLVHLIITTPLILFGSVWLYMLSNKEKISTKVWKINLLGLLIPLMSMQTGVTYYHYDIVGLVVATVILVFLVVILGYKVKQYVSS